MSDRPIVGIAVFIMNEDNNFLIGLIKSQVGNNTWGLPGGKLDKYEEFEHCAIREIKEETNLDISDLTYIATTNDIMNDIDSHYVTIFFATKTFTGELKVVEPEKCEEWMWCNPNELPQNLFLPLKNFIDGNLIS